ncbi:transmembrane protein 185A isoform X1 [Cotesia glomerata]|uniref:Similar to TMEM185B: Transmembrane protein 185B (Homo sapiens) n=1 Tax=Cotesia congregata TaxID=51543 RepID=A0A8J2HLP3_COTCN|nr:transmembrane protein 185A isoform X1 [Cotesia glomerata]CAG5103165.1 Similar to TMEM185B: Transmembrane protein 185B (Homo sapiens) [Cotesia congregata]
MNLQTLFQDFNPSKFLVHSCLMIFTALFALRLDGFIEWSYWSIFSPIWLWKGMVILGATVGSYVWWRHPHARLEGDAYVHYKAMLITLALHLILLMFELLVCDKLESDRHLWILVFIPLIFISIVSIAVCIWAVKHDRSFELELFCAVNVLQFIFLALKLDQFITWSWEVVFVPLWALLCLSLVAVLYTIVFAAVLLRAPQVNARVRRTSLNSALAYTFLVVPILVFQVLLANKLDGDLSLNYTTIAAPLLLSHMTLIFMSFGAKGGNRWWFGIRKDFCHFLLGLCPLLQEYGNISYQPRSDHDQPPSEPMVSDKNEKHIKKIDLMKPVVPIISIDMPD